MAYEKIVLKKEDSDDKLYPRTLVSQLVDDDENTVDLQTKITAGEGISIDEDNTIATNLFINNEKPTYDEENKIYNWNLDSTNRTIKSEPTLNDTTSLISSDGIVRYTLQRISTITTKAYTNASTYGEDVASNITSAYSTFIFNLPNPRKLGDLIENINYTSSIRLYVFLADKSSPIQITLSNPEIEPGVAIYTRYPGMSVRYKNSSGTITEDTVANFFQSKGVYLDTSGYQIETLYKTLYICVCMDGYVS